MAKKDQERVNYAWLYGAQARKDGKERAVPPFWNDYAEAWLHGFDGVAIAESGKSKPVGDQLEAELGEAGVASNPPAGT